MNNEELKKKIVEVLVPVVKSGNISCNEENACKRCWFPCEIERTAGRLADALIAAGIGDVKEAEIEYRNAILMAVKSQTISSERSRYMELNKSIAEHRAEVAERALYNACCEQNKHWCVQCNSFAECDTSNEMCIEAKKHAEELIKQAEKELAEENGGKKEV